MMFTLNRHSLTTVLPPSDPSNDNLSLLMSAYYPSLHRIATRKLDYLNVKVFDADDACSDAFLAFWEGLQDDRFSITSDQDCFYILRLLVARKCYGIVHFLRSEKRSAYITQSMDDATADGIIGADCDPFLTMAAADMLSFLMSRLDDIDRRILSYRLDGYSLDDVATLTHMDKKAVEQRQYRYRQVIAQMKDVQ